MRLKLETYPSNNGCQSYGNIHTCRSKQSLWFIYATVRAKNMRTHVFILLKNYERKKFDNFWLGMNHCGVPIFWLLCHKYLCQWVGGNWNLQDVINFAVFFWGLPLLIGFVWDSFVDSDAFWWSQAQWLDNEYEGYRLVTATHLSAPKEEKHVNTDWYIIDTIKPQLHSTHESKMTYELSF